MELSFRLWDDCSCLSLPPVGKQTTFTNNACSRVNSYFEMKQKIRDSLVANTFLFSTILIDSNFGIKHEQHIRREIRLEGWGACINWHFI